jgi:hypothetical protein
MEATNPSSNCDLSEEQSDHKINNISKVPYNQEIEKNGDADFTDEQLTSRDDELTKVPYDPRPHEDKARRQIAYWLLGILSGLLIWMLLLLSFGIVPITELKEFSIILGPVITLVSAATGFYYGTKQT